MSTISIALELAVSDRLCMDLLTACVEGGSAYWLACARVERAPDASATKIVGCYDREDESTKWPDVTVETMREGIRRLLSGVVKVNSATHHSLLMAVVDADSCQWDADDADCVLQAGLLNDIVYG